MDSEDIPFVNPFTEDPCDHLAAVGTFILHRNGNTFRNFKALAQWMGDNLPVENAVIDGEVACVDDSGRL